MLCTPARQLQGMRLLVLCLLACGLWHAAGSARSSKPRTGGLGAERDSDKILSGDPAVGCPCRAGLRRADWERRRRGEGHWAM